MNPNKASTHRLLITAICLTAVLCVLLGVALLLPEPPISASGSNPQLSTHGTTLPHGTTTLLQGTTTSIVSPTTKPIVPPTTKPIVLPTTGPSVPPTTEPTVPPTTEPTVPPTTEPTVPPTTGSSAIKVSSATIGATGDFLMNLPVVNSAAIVNGVHDFANTFTYYKEYISAVDMAVANLETTLAGADYVNSDGTIGYHGSFRFNSPDGIVPSLQAAGFDLLLTANNHTYDTTSTGFYRTQEVLKSYGMNYLGTLTNNQQTLWQVHEVNGIKIGMICYTYENDDDPDKVKLNGISMNSTTGALIGTFSYGQLNTFYAELADQIADMRDAGAEAIVLYIHWGDEYKTTQNKKQSTMAQKICDLGVDVIVGGHPHVVQPIQLLTSTTDATHKTVCIYSLGNALSNQRISEMSLKTGHTEDGLLFQFSFAKYSDGTVILESVNVLPTWVDMYYDTDAQKKVYTILPLDTGIEDWKTAFSLTDERYTAAVASYERTMAIVGTGLSAVKDYLAQLVADTEAALGIYHS